MAEIAGLTASICQFIDATTKVYRYLNTVKNASSERAGLFQEASHLVPIVTDLRTLVETSDANDPWITGVLQLAGPLEKVKTAMEGLKEKLNKHHWKISYLGTNQGGCEGDSWNDRAVQTPC
jgi:hypothetical protein